MHAEDHFDDDFLMRLLDDPAELQRLGREKHFNACESCRNKLESYRRFQSFLQRESNFEVPADWVTRMVRIFEAEEQKKSTSSSKIFGWLVFDSLLADAAGVRMPARAGTERHLIFDSTRFRVDLLIESADPDQVVLIGQLAKTRSGEDYQLAGAAVEVTVGENVFKDEVNSTGEFIVPVGRLIPGDPIEIQFQFEDVLSLIVVILS